MVICNKAHLCKAEGKCVDAVPHESRNDPYSKVDSYCTEEAYCYYLKTMVKCEPIKEETNDNNTEETPGVSCTVDTAGSDDNLGDSPGNQEQVQPG